MHFFTDLSLLAHEVRAAFLEYPVMNRRYQFKRPRTDRSSVTGTPHSSIPFTFCLSILPGSHFAPFRGAGITELAAYMNYFHQLAQVSIRSMGLSPQLPSLTWAYGFYSLFSLHLTLPSERELELELLALPKRAGTRTGRRPHNKQGNKQRNKD